MQLSLDAWSLSMEATSVIGLRVMKMAAGGAAGASEAQLMFSEKLEAGMALHTMALTGQLGLHPSVAASRTISHLHGKVSANHRRLTRG